MYIIHLRTLKKVAALYAYMKGYAMKRKLMIILCTCIFLNLHLKHMLNAHKNRVSSFTQHALQKIPAVPMPTAAGR